MKSFIQFLKTRILNESIDISTITIPEFDEYIQSLINQTGFNYYQLMNYLLDQEGLGKSSNEDDSAYEQKRIALLNHFRTHYSYLNKTKDTDFRDAIHSLLPTRTVLTGRIDRLSREQRNEIPNFVRRWVNVILNGKTNEELVIDAFNNLGFDNVTFVDSLEGIDGIVENIRFRRVFDQVYSQVSHQLGDGVWNQVRDQFYNQVGNEIWHHAFNQVGRQFLDEEVWNQVLDQSCFAMFSYFENILNVEITNQNYEHVKDILVNSRFIFSTNNQDEIFVLRK